MSRRAFRPTALSMAVCLALGTSTLAQAADLVLTPFNTTQTFSGDQSFDTILMNGDVATYQVNVDGKLSFKSFNYMNSQNSLNLRASAIDFTRASNAPDNWLRIDLGMSLSLATNVDTGTVAIADPKFWVNTGGTLSLKDSHNVTIKKYNESDNNYFYIYGQLNASNITGKLDLQKANYVTGAFTVTDVNEVSFVELTYLVGGELSIEGANTGINFSHLQLQLNSDNKASKLTIRDSKRVQFSNLLALYGGEVALENVESVQSSNRQYLLPASTPVSMSIQNSSQGVSLKRLDVIARNNLASSYSVDTTPELTLNSRVRTYNAGASISFSNIGHLTSNVGPSFSDWADDGTVLTATATDKALAAFEASYSAKMAIDAENIEINAYMKREADVDRAKTFSALLSNQSAELTMSSTGNLRIQMNSDVPYVSIAPDSIGTSIENGVYADGTTVSTVKAAMGRSHVGQKAERADLKLSVAGQADLSLYTYQQSSGNTNAHRSFRESVLLSSNAWLSLEADSNHIYYDTRAQGENTAGTINYDYWGVYSSLINVSSNGILDVTARKGDNLFEQYKAGNFTRGLDMSALGGEMNVRALEGRNIILVKPVQFSSQFASSNTAPRTIGAVMGTVYGSLVANPQLSATLTLEGRENQMRVEGAAEQLSGVAGQSYSLINVIANAGDNTIEIQPSALSNQLTKLLVMGADAHSASVVTLRSESGANRIQLNMMQDWDQEDFEYVMYAGGLSYSLGALTFEAHDNLIDVHTQEEFSDFTAGAYAQQSGRVTLRALGGRNEIHSSDLGLAANQSTANSQLSTVEMLATASSNNLIYAEKNAIYANSGQVRVEAQAGKNIIYSQEQGIFAVSTARDNASSSVTIDGETVLSARTALVTEQRQNATQAPAVLLNYDGTSIVSGIVSAKGGSIDVAPRSSAQPNAKLLLTGGAVARDQGRLTMDLGRGGYWAGDAMDFAYKSFANTAAGSIDLTLGESAEWRFPAQSSITTLRGNRGLVRFGSDDHADGLALHVGEIEDSHTFAMQLSKEGAKSDMLYIVNGTSEAQSLLITNRAALFDSLNFGDAVRFAVIKHSQNEFRDGTVVGRVNRGSRLANVTIEYRAIAEDALNTASYNDAYNNGPQKAGSEAIAERYGDGGAREPVLLRRPRALSDTPDSSATTETSGLERASADAPQNVYLVLNATPDINEPSRAGKASASASQHYAVSVDTFTKRMGQMQYGYESRALDENWASWGRVTLARSGHKDSGRLSGANYEVGFQKILDKGPYHVTDDRELARKHRTTMVYEQDPLRTEERSISFAFGDHDGRFDALSGNQQLRDLSLNFYRTIEYHPSFKERREAKEPWELDRYRWSDHYIKIHRLSTNYDFVDSNMVERVSGSHKRWIVNASHEIGWRYPLSETWSVMPQGQLQLSWMKGTSWRDSTGLKHRLDNAWSLIGRLGFDLAAEWGEEELEWSSAEREALGNVPPEHKKPNDKLNRFYVKASLLHEFLGGADMSIGSDSASFGAVWKTQLTGRQTWGVIGAGYIRKLKRDRNLMIDVETAVGSGLKSNVSGRVVYSWRW